jgi:hypothetical protein
MKLCKRCFFRKNNTSFGSNKKSKDGRKNICRQCEYEEELKKKSEAIRSEPDVYVQNDLLVLYIRRLLEKEILKKKLDDIYYKKNKNICEEKFLSSKLFDKKIRMEEDIVKHLDKTNASYTIIRPSCLNDK